jgi:hypothetical protein
MRAKKNNTSKNHYIRNGQTHCQAGEIDLSANILDYYADNGSVSCDKVLDPEFGKRSFVIVPLALIRCDALEFPFTSSRCDLRHLTLW